LVRNEVRRDIALIELHAFSKLELQHRETAALSLEAYLLDDEVIEGEVLVVDRKLNDVFLGWPVEAVTAIQLDLVLVRVWILRVIVWREQGRHNLVLDHAFGAFLEVLLPLLRRGKLIAVLFQQAGSTVTLKKFFEFLDIVLGHFEPLNLVVSMLRTHVLPLRLLVINDLHDGVFLQFERVFDLVCRFVKGDLLEFLLVS